MCSMFEEIVLMYLRTYSEFWDESRHVQNPRKDFELHEKEKPWRLPGQAKLEIVEVHSGLR